jgi:hypothetical protein
VSTAFKLDTIDSTLGRFLDEHPGAIQWAPEHRYNGGEGGNVLSFPLAPNDGDDIIKAGDPTIREMIKHGLPQLGLSREVNVWRAKNAKNLLRGARRVVAARALNLPTFYGALWLRKIDGQTGDVTDYGLASLRVVTTAGVGYIVDAFQNLTEVEVFKYHGVGTGTNSESSSDTALQTELTTQYNPDSTRATGSQTEGASGNIYRTVGTITVDASAAVTEHGVFSQAATGGGTLLDRSVFTVVNLAASDSLQVPYELTFPAGS